MSGERWRIACHESGHAVAAIELRGRCDGLLIDADGGQAHINQLCGDRLAFAIAAGPAAEHLAGEHQAPDVEPAPLASVVSEQPSLLSVDRDFALACQMADVPGIGRRSPSDSRFIAEWAIGGREDAPELWAGRVAFAKRVASQIVEKNGSQIVALASALFIRGRLTGAEIVNLLTRK
jgi:hypothetical protein